LQPSANYKDSRPSTKERKHEPLFSQTFETIRIIKIKILYDERKVDGNRFPLFKAKFDTLSEREIKNVSASL
jgi:hypothetical protein